MGFLDSEGATNPIDLLGQDVPSSLQIIAKNTTGALGEVFDISVDFSVAQFCAIQPGSKPRYENINKKGMGDDPTIAVLCLGTDERCFLLRKKRTIRRCSLRAGDMLLVSGNTHDVEWSVEKAAGIPDGDNTPTCCFLFLGGSHSPCPNMISGSESESAQHDYPESDTPLSDYVASINGDLHAIETPSLVTDSVALLSRESVAALPPVNVAPPLSLHDLNPPNASINPNSPSDPPLTPLETTIIQKTEGGIIDMLSLIHI